MQTLLLEICFRHFNELSLKLRIEIFSANVVRLCNNVSLIAPPELTLKRKFYWETLYI